MAAYRLSESAEGNGPPNIIVDVTGGTTSWRDAKKALRSWYLEQAAALRSVSEKDYFNNDGTE
jgi:uncharacterized protein (UPF0548 family)